ncbi:MAG: hypothetical protein ACE5I2_00435 [Anaerolineae bacterium]
MKPFRKHVAIAVDGGGIKGVIVARALAILEEYLGQSSHEIFRLAAGTSTTRPTGRWRSRPARRHADSRRQGVWPQEVENILVGRQVK